MRSLPSVIIENKNKLVNNEPWVWLMQMSPNQSDVIYLASNTIPITYGGNTYVPFPFDVGEATEDGQGNLSSMTLTITNITKEFGNLIEANRGFSGNAIVLMLWHQNAIALTQNFRIQTCEADNYTAVFTVGNDDLFKIDFPQGKYFRRRCRWIYKGIMCGYAGPIPYCDKTLRGSGGCEFHFNQTRFGGFPGIPVQR